MYKSEYSNIQKFYAVVLFKLCLLQKGFQSHNSLIALTGQDLFWESIPYLPFSKFNRFDYHLTKQWVLSPKSVRFSRIVLSKNFDGRFALVNNTFMGSLRILVEIIWKSI